MSFTNRARFLASAIVTALAIAVMMPMATTSASAHGAYKHRDGDRQISRYVRRHKHARRHWRSYRHRDPAIFAHDVDLSRPGGPERFFELLREENR